MKFPALLLPWLLAPRSLQACAVCMGQADNPNMAKAYAWGIFVLMAFTMMIITLFTYAVYRMETSRKGVTGKSA